MSASKQLINDLNKRAKKINLLLSISNIKDVDLAILFKKTKDDFLNSKEWKDLRIIVLDKYGTKCMKCGCVPKYSKNINVDHIKPRKYYPDLALEFNNLQVLCSKCNKNKGNKSQIDYRPFE